MPVLHAARQAVFGDPFPPLTVLQSDPWKVVAYLRRIKRLTPVMIAAMGKAEDAEEEAEDAEEPKGIG